MIIRITIIYEKRYVKTNHKFMFYNILFFLSQIDILHYVYSAPFDNFAK